MVTLTNVYAKSNYDRLRINKVLGIFSKTDNNKNDKMKNNLVVIRDQPGSTKQWLNCSVWPWIRVGVTSELTRLIRSRSDPVRSIQQLAVCLSVRRLAYR